MRTAVGRPTRQDQIIDLYLQGHSIEQIRQKTGYTQLAYIRLILKNHGVLRPEDANPMGIDVPKVLALMNAGWNMEKIVGEFGYLYSADELENAAEKYLQQIEERKKRGRR